MKKCLLILSALNILFASCSNDDTTNGPGSLLLKKTETFIPSKAIFDNPQMGGNILRTVKYYSYNTIVADSTFNRNGSLHSWTVYTPGTNSLTIAAHLAGSGEMTRYIYNFDFQGNIIHEKRISYPTQQTEEGYYTYDENAITYNREINDDYPLPFQIVYGLNSAGLIQSMTGYNLTRSLMLQNDKVISETVFNNITQTQEYIINNSYYTVTVPSAALKPVAALNRTIIINRDIAPLAIQGNHYIKEHGVLHYDKEFNNMNYITVDRCFNTSFTSSDPLSQDPLGYETFYYYE